MARRTPCSRVAEPAAEPSLAEEGVAAPVEAEGETAAVAAVAMAPSGVEAVAVEAVATESASHCTPSPLLASNSAPHPPDARSRTAWCSCHSMEP